MDPRFPCLLVVALFAGCTGSSTSADAGTNDANTDTSAKDAFALTDYKVAYVANDNVANVANVLNIWHSRDGRIEQWDQTAVVQPLFPAFSSDGRLLFALLSDSSLGVYDPFANLVASHAAPLAMPSISFATPRPDFGRFVLCNEMTGYQMTVATLDADGTYRPIPLDVCPYRYSPDGHTLVGDDTSGVFLVQDDGTGRVELAPGCTSPSFNFDGTELVYICYSNHGHEIRTFDLATQTESTVSDLFTKTSLDNPAFTPDGTSIVFGAGLDIVSLMRLDIASREITTLIDDVGVSPYLPWILITVALDE